MITVKEDILQQTIARRASIDGQVSKALDLLRAGQTRRAIYALAFLPLQELETKVVDHVGDLNKREIVGFHLRGIAKRLEEIAKAFEE